MAVTSPDRMDWIVRGLAVGGYAGLVTSAVAGIGARIAMRLFAVSVDQPVAFTVSGTMTILFFGGLLGTGMGVGYVVIRRVAPLPWPILGAILGSGLAGLVLFTFGQQPIDEATADPGFGARLFAGLAVVVGLATAAAAAWFDQRLPRPDGRDSSRVVGIGAMIGLVGFLGLLLIVSSIIDLLV